MRLLLDTHAFLWWLDGDRRLPPKVRRVIADDTNAVFVSAASAWEISTKYRLGRLPGAADVASDIAGSIGGQSFSPLEITVPHAQRAGSLAGTHQDPFDRMLIAQSLMEDLPIVSNEAVFDAYGVVRLW
ncbi:MAG: type II toxin-antitoxin system VapC family toxin [Vicinamibacterales bacterium]